MARPFESVRFHAFAPLAAFPRYARVRALGVVERPLSGYWAVVVLGLRVDPMLAPLTGNPVDSLTDARSHRNRNTFPPAACGTSSGCQHYLRPGSVVRSIATSS